MTITTMTITPTQKLVLQSAAGRENGSIFPLPNHIKGGAAKKVVESMEGKGMIDEDGIITKIGLGEVDPDGTSIYATQKDTNEEHEAEDEVLENECQHYKGMECCPGDYRECESCDQIGELMYTEEDETFDSAANDAAMADYADQKEREQMAFERQQMNSRNAMMQAEYAAERAERAELLARATNALADDETTVMADDDNQTILSNIFTDAAQDATEGQPAKVRRTRENSKQAMVIKMMKRPEGATAAQIALATNWQAHTIRGFVSLAQKNMGLKVIAIRTKKTDDIHGFTTYFTE